MGSGKGQNKRVNTVNNSEQGSENIVSKLSLGSYVNRYILTNIKPRDQKFMIGNFITEEIIGNDELIKNFIKDQDFDLFIFNKEPETPDFFPYDEEMNNDCFTSINQNVMGWCLTYDPRANTKTIILINKRRFNDNFKESFDQGKTLFPDHFLYALNNNDLLNTKMIAQQAILLHELGHALDETFNNQTKEQHIMAELVAELFAAKTIEKLYGENNFAQSHLAANLIKEFKNLSNELDETSARVTLLKAEKRADVLVEKLIKFIK